MRSPVRPLSGRIAVRHFSCALEFIELITKIHVICAAVPVSLCWNSRIYNLEIALLCLDPQEAVHSAYADKLLLAAQPLTR